MSLQYADNFFLLYNKNLRKAHDLYLQVKKLLNALLSELKTVV